MKIKKLIFIIIAMILFLVTGCNNTYNRSSNIKDNNTKSMLRFWYYWDDENSQKQISELISNFNKSQKNIQIKLEYIPLAEYRKRLSLGMVTEDLPDIVMIKGSSQQYYINKGMFFDISEYIKENIPMEEYNSQAIKTCTVRKSIYGLPFTMTVQAMVYNEDILNSVGCITPKSWNELKECAKTIKQHNNIYPIGFSGLENQYMMLQFLPLLWSADGDINSINNENGLRAMTYFSSLFLDELIDVSTVNLTNNDMISQFANQETAIIFTSADRLVSLFNTKVTFNWSVAEIPFDKTPVSIFDTNNIAIINNNNSSLALEFLSYIADENNMKDYLNKLYMLSPRSDILESQYKSNTTIRQYSKIIGESKYIPIYTKWDDISDGITDALRGFITNQLTPQQSVNYAQSVIDKSLKE